MPAPHRAPPAVVAKAQPVVIRTPRLVTITTTGDPLASTLFAFSEAVPGSDWWSDVSRDFGVSVMRAGAHVVGPPMPAQMTTSDIGAYVRQVVEASGSDAAPDGATIYLLYLGPGTQGVDSTNRLNCGCTAFAGYHFALGEAGDAVAVVQRCSSDIDSMTNIASHEIIEAATDPTGAGFFEPSTRPPWSGSVWAGNEVADLCAGTRIHEGAWEYQRSFSNTATANGDDPCVPALSEPYYNVTAAQDWYALATGATVSVAITGWSTAPTEDWFVYPSPTLPNGFDVKLTSDESASAAGVPFYGINNGKNATLAVTAMSAKSGASTVVRLLSRLSSPGSDSLHVWAVGFYVP